MWDILSMIVHKAAGLADRHCMVVPEYGAGPAG